MTRLRLENVVQRYREEKTGRTFDALRVQELAVEPGEVVSLVGPNGSGKSTLLETLAFLNPPDEGRVLLAGNDPWQGGAALAARRRVPLLLQQTVLFSTSVLRNVMFGLRTRGLRHSDAEERAHSALELVGMDHLAHRRHAELSGGERRRVALARVLALESNCIVLDEPTAGLDAQSEQMIEDLIRRLNTEHGTTVVMASHNVQQAEKLSTRIVTLLDGKLIPMHLDNLLFGTMSRAEGGYELRIRQGWAHVFPETAFMQNSWEGIAPIEGEVQVGIPAAALSVSDAATATDQGLRGAIDSLRKEDGSCRIRVRLPGGPSLQAQVPAAKFATLGSDLAKPVSLCLADGSVCVLPRRKSGEDVGQFPDAGSSAKLRLGT